MDLQKIKEQVRISFATLDKREREVLCMRFGVGGKTKTLEEVGKKFGVTKERIRQIEAKALEKIKAIKVINSS